MSQLTIDVRGLDVLNKALSSLKDRINVYMAAAGKEAADLILDTEGLRTYPPAGDGNSPPEPYYIRGKGTQTAYGNNNKSERYGTQFYTESRGYETVVGNRASYAQYLAGDDQAKRMAGIGWRKLIDVGNEKIDAINEVYQQWVDKAIEDLDLQP